MMKVGGAGILVGNRGGNILVLHRESSVPEGNKWGIPGGNIKGRSLIDVALIKTKQETGLEFKEGELSMLGNFSYKADGRDVAFRVYTAKLGKHKPNIVINPDGHDRYLWSNPKILLKRNDLMVGMYPILKKYIKNK